MVVGAAYGIGLDMRQLPFNPVRGGPQLVESGAAGGPCGVGALFTAPAQSLEHLSE